MYQQSMIRRTSFQKRRAAIARAAIAIAKQKGDPLYKKYVRYRNLYLQMKRDIVEKYFARARQAVMQKVK